LAANSHLKLALLSLGLFHWFGVGEFEKNEAEAIELWRRGGLEIPESQLRMVEVQEQDVDRSDRFNESRDNREPFAVDDSKRIYRYLSSFELWDPERVRAIESVKTLNDILVSEFLRTATFEMIVNLTTTGIVQEGNRELDGKNNAQDAAEISAEIRKCSDIRSLLQKCAYCYTKETFLYRRVNQFLRESPTGDLETGKNLGLYIGLLRECFCIDSGVFTWERPEILYRGVDFSVEVVADYARRKHQPIWWQGFTSASKNINVALKFGQTVLFEISTWNPSPSVGKNSAFQSEKEFILNPYQQFYLGKVRWKEEINRWVISVKGEESPQASPWLRWEESPPEPS
jgi:hypothetical protein